MFELLLCLLGISVSFAFSAWLWRVRGDAIRTEGDAITTPLGTFRFTSASKVLSIETPDGQRAAIEIVEPARVIVDPDMDDALASEALLSLVGATNFGVSDLLPRYRDRIKTNAIVLEAGSLRIPIAALKQYRAFDMFDSIGGNSSIRGVLSGLRLYRDVDVVAEARAFEIADSLRNQGLKVT